MGEVPRYLSLTAIADRFEVAVDDVMVWRQRYREAAPEPDAMVDDRPVWCASSWPAWQAWRRSVAARVRSAVPEEALEYMGQTELARRFEVSLQTVANWRSRYGPGHAVPVPAPDAFASGAPIWLESSWPAWQAWVERRLEWAHQRRVATAAEVGSRPRGEGTRKIDAVVAGIRRRIEEGTWAPGAALPPSRVVGGLFGASAQTAAGAIALLKDEGVLAGKGSGHPVRVAVTGRASPSVEGDQ